MDDILCRFSGGKLYLNTMISSLVVIGKVTIVLVIIVFCHHHLGHHPHLRHHHHFGLRHLHHRHLGHHHHFGLRYLGHHRHRGHHHHLVHDHQSFQVNAERYLMCEPENKLSGKNFFKKVALTLMFMPGNFFSSEFYSPWRLCQV